MYESSARRPGQPAAYKNQHFTTVSDVRPARSDERVARASSKFAFHHSFGCPMSMKRREGCERTPADSHFTTVLGTRRARSDERVARAMCKIRISPQFSTSDEHEVTRGLRRRRANFACHHSFGRPTSTKWREGCLPSCSAKPTLRKKRKKFLKKSWSTAILSRSSQHSHSQQIVSADLLSTAILSRSSDPSGATMSPRFSEGSLWRRYSGPYIVWILSGLRRMACIKPLQLASTPMISLTTCNRSVLEKSSIKNGNCLRVGSP